MKVVLILIANLILVSSCNDQIICKKLYSDFIKNVVKQDDSIYYWNGDYNSMEKVFQTHKDCITSLNSEDLQSQFKLLRTEKENYSIVVDLNVLPKDEVTQSLAIVNFQIDTNTNLVDDFKIVSIESVNKEIDKN